MSRRIRRRLAAVVVAAVVLNGACATSDDGAAPATDAPATVAPAGVTTTRPAANGASAAEEQVAAALFEMANDERRRRGVSPLERDERLDDLARRWSTHMAGLGRLQHRDLGRVLRDEGLSDRYRALGENIYRSTGPVPAGQIHTGWMRSPGHRENLLAAGFGHIGIGVTCTPDGALYATQEFGRVLDSDHPPLAEGSVPPEQPLVHQPGDGPSCSGDGPPGSGAPG